MSVINNRGGPMFYWLLGGLALLLLLVFLVTVAFSIIEKKLEFARYTGEFKVTNSALSTRFWNSVDLSLQRGDEPTLELVVPMNHPMWALSKRLKPGEIVRMALARDLGAAYSLYVVTKFGIIQRKVQFEVFDMS
jgi:hypothetical protein